MTSQEIVGGYLVVLEKGEPLVNTLEEFCSANNITAGFVTGLGAVTKAELGFYDLEAKQYHWKEFNQLMEITALNGTVSKSNLHIHVTLAGKDYQAMGGHLKEALVGGTCELYLRTFEDSLERKPDHTTGLNLLDL